MPQAASGLALRRFSAVPAASQPAPDEPKIEDDSDEQKNKLLEAQYTWRCSLEIRVHDQRERQEEKTEYRDQDPPVDTGEKISEQPKEDDRDARKSDREYCE